jgi:hypothetical protein
MKHENLIQWYSFVDRVDTEKCMGVKPQRKSADGTKQDNVFQADTRWRLEMEKELSRKCEASIKARRKRPDISFID